MLRFEVSALLLSNVNTKSPRDKKGWTQRVGLANVSPKGLYHCIKGWFKLDRS